MAFVSAPRVTSESGTTPTGARIAILASLAYVATRLFVVFTIPPRGAFADIYPREWSIPEILARAGDGAHYQMIAKFGYPPAVDSSMMVSCASLRGWEITVLCPWGDGLRLNDLAFPPLFPLGIRLGGSLGLSHELAALALSFLASLVAAALIGVFAARLVNPRAAIIAAALWGVLPLSIIQQMGRPESLFTALAAGALYLMHRRRLPWAAVLVAAAGLTRIQSAALVAALAWTCIVELRAGAMRLREAIAVLGLSLSGLLLTLAHAAWSTGYIDGYSRVQESWGNRPGLGKIDYVRDAVVTLTVPDIFVTVTLIFAVVMLYALTRIPGSAAALVYSAVTLTMVLLVQGGYHVHSLRYLLPAFPLLLPAAAAISRLPRTVAVALIVALGLTTSELTRFFLTSWPWSF